MKIFQVLNGLCHYEVRAESLEAARSLYAPTIMLVEAPDNVFPGWGYDSATQTFIRPEGPEGWVYDEETGTWYDPAGMIEPEPPEIDYSEFLAGLMEGYIND